MTLSASAALLFNILTRIFSSVAFGSMLICDLRISYVMVLLASVI